MAYQPTDPTEPPAPAPDNPGSPACDDLRRSREIQGNILAGFLKDHQIFLLLQFTSADEGRAWLAGVLPRIATTDDVATFNEQFSAARRARGGDDPENLVAVWTNVSLTADGLRLLAPAVADDLKAFAAFAAGPAARATDLRDTERGSPDRWLFGAPTITVPPPTGAGSRDVHAILTIAADRAEDLKAELDQHQLRAARHNVLVVFAQRGDTLPGRRAGHEHFGFKDGISQPGIIGFHESEPGRHGREQRKGHPGTEMIQPGEFILGCPRETGEPLTGPAWALNGSFQVLRRLRQDVPGWWAQVTTHAEVPQTPELALSEDRLAAKLVGRWRSGTPLAKAPERDNRSARRAEDDNDFDFEDEDGSTTPLAAHIRKMYPRNNGAFENRRRRILRRGIPFGRHFDPAAGRGHGVDAPRGLVFNAFMASIEEQFEFLQIAWANDADFPPGTGAGHDPVIGAGQGPVRVPHPSARDRAFDLRRFVHAEGAVYAFAPSMTTLQRIAEGEHAADEG